MSWLGRGRHAIERAMLGWVMGMVLLLLEQQIAGRQNRGGALSRLRRRIAPSRRD